MKKSLLLLAPIVLVITAFLLFGFSNYDSNSPIAKANAKPAFVQTYITFGERMGVPDGYGHFIKKVDYSDLYNYRVDYVDVPQSYKTADNNRFPVFTLTSPGDWMEYHRIGNTAQITKKTKVASTPESKSVTESADGIQLPEEWFTPFYNLDFSAKWGEKINKKDIAVGSKSDWLTPQMPFALSFYDENFSGGMIKTTHASLGIVSGDLKGTNSLYQVPCNESYEAELKVIGVPPCNKSGFREVEIRMIYSDKYKIPLLIDRLVDGYLISGMVAQDLKYKKNP